jgi:hypothetical protein
VTLLPRPPLLIERHVKKPLRTPSSGPTTTPSSSHVQCPPRAHLTCTKTQPSPIRHLPFTPPPHTAFASPTHRLCLLVVSTRARGRSLKATTSNPCPRMARASIFLEEDGEGVLEGPNVHARLIWSPPSGKEPKLDPPPPISRPRASCEISTYSSPLPLHLSRRCAALLRRCALPLPLRRMGSRCRPPTSREAALPLPCPLHWGGAKPLESREFLCWCLLLFPTLAVP